jgi:hypothetical protein
MPANFSYQRVDADFYENVVKNDESGSLKRLWDATAEWREKDD